MERNGTEWDLGKFNPSVIKVAHCDSIALHSSLDEEGDEEIQYFNDDYTYGDICKFLEVRHGIILGII